MCPLWFLFSLFQQPASPDRECNQECRVDAVSSPVSHPCFTTICSTSVSILVWLGTLLRHFHVYFNSIISNTMCIYVYSNSEAEYCICLLLSRLFLFSILYYFVEKCLRLFHPTWQGHSHQSMMWISSIVNFKLNVPLKLSCTRVLLKSDILTWKMICSSYFLLSLVCQRFGCC